MFAITLMNGKMPQALLAVADDGPNGPQDLRIDAAASWGRMLANGMPPHCLRSGYRDLAQQQTEVNAAALGQTPSALPPGQSQHGEGVAADVDEPARSWIIANGAPYGWVAHLVPNEPWHFQYDPTLDQRPQPPQPPKEDDMIPLIVLLYSQYLDRGPSNTEQLNWSDAFSGRTAADAHAMFRTSKAEAGTVVSAFRQFLHRDPSQTEITAWTAAGETIDQVWNGVRNSPEAKAVQ